MAYAEKVVSGGMTRRQEINRLEYARALTGNPSITWKQAQKQLDSSQRIIVQQMATMKQAEKAKQAEFFHGNNYKGTQTKWQQLIKDNPANAKVLEQQKRMIELKMVFGKAVLSDKQKYEIQKVLEYLDVDDYESYWGY